MLGSYYLFRCLEILHGWSKNWSAKFLLLGLRVRIPPQTWIAASCDCCMLSSRGFCVWRPEKSYPAWSIWIW